MELVAELDMTEQLTLSHIHFSPPYNSYSFGNGVEGAMVDHASLRTNYPLTSLLKPLELLYTRLTLQASLYDRPSINPGFFLNSCFILEYMYFYETFLPYLRQNENLCSW